MKISTFERIFNNSFKKRDSFKHIADYMIENHTEGLTDERKHDLSADSALCMAIGEAMGKNKYLLTGGIVGVLGTVATVGIINKFKKIETETNVDREESIVEQAAKAEMEYYNNLKSK